MKAVRHVLEYGLLDYPTVDAEGMVHIPDRPGLGAEIDWEFKPVQPPYSSSYKALCVSLPTET